MADDDWANLAAAQEINDLKLLEKVFFLTVTPIEKPIIRLGH